MTAIVRSSSAQRFVLHDVDWESYEELLKSLGDRHVFVTYAIARRPAPHGAATRAIFCASPPVCPCRP